jgi:hypothetical protein
MNAHMALRTECFPDSRKREPEASDKAAHYLDSPA